MRRYGDISHYRAPYKDSVFSGFGYFGDDQPAAATTGVPVAQATPAQLAALGTIGTIVGDQSSDSTSGVISRKIKASSQANIAEWISKVPFDILVPHPDKDSKLQLATGVLADSSSKFNPKTGLAPNGSLWDLTLFMTGSAPAPTALFGRGAEKNQPKFGWVLISALPNADRPQEPNLLVGFCDSLEDTARFQAFVRQYLGISDIPEETPLAAVLKAPGEAFTPAAMKVQHFNGSALPSFSIPKDIGKGKDKGKGGGMSTAAMLGYGAVGVLLVAGLYMAFGKKKRGGTTFEANGRRRHRRRH